MGQPRSKGVIWPVRWDMAGDVVVSGSLYDSGTLSDTAFIKLSGVDGSEMWRHTIDGGGSPDRAFAVKVDPSGDVIGAASLGFEPPESVSTIAKLSGGAGSEIWRKDFPDDAGPAVGAIVVTDTGDVAAEGASGGSVPLLNFYANDDPLVELEELVEMDDAPAPVPARGDEDLDMFDQAFDALKPAGGSGRIPVEKPRLRVAPDPEAEERRREPTELSAPTDEQLLGLDEESGLAGLEAVAPVRKPPSPPRPAAKAAPRGRSGGERGVAELRQELDDKEQQLADLHEQQVALEEQAQQLKDQAIKRDASAKALQQRADALAAAAKKFERELTAARDQLKAGGGKSQATRLDVELEKAREEISALTGEKDLLREERDDLRKQLNESQTAAKQNEERAIRAYQKMKGDEKLRERMRKALQIALALLEDGVVDAGTGSEPGKKSA